MKEKIRRQRKQQGLILALLHYLTVQYSFPQKILRDKAPLCAVNVVFHLRQT